jgi:hypothetical protein
MKNYKFSTVIVTAYLVVYTFLFQAEAPLPVLAWMFVISPFLVIWMAYTILRYGGFTGRELHDNEEWGYDDKPMNWGKNL